MANIHLSAKSGSDWTANELTAFNIHVETVDAAVFFNTAQLPDPPVAHTVLTNKSKPHGPLANQDRLFFHYMEDAVNGVESSVDDFAGFILRMFEYNKPDHVIHGQKEVSFTMCGMMVNANPSVCVMSDSGLLLLVQEDKACPSFFLDYLS